MPINTKKLTATLVKMRDLFIADPTNAVRSKSFITTFQNYCADELRSYGLEKNGLQIKIEKKFSVGRGRVEADIGIFNENGEPKLIVDVRSQMSSLGKNFNNYIRMKAGEVESIHERYPECIVGLIYIHPTGDLKTKHPVNPVGIFNYTNASRQLASLTGRASATDSASIYEHVAYCVIDFSRKLPRLSATMPTEPELRFEDFFDKISETLKNR